MKRVTARVHNGRLVVDEPTDMPEGTQFELQLFDPGDDLGDEERAALHCALAVSREQLRSGEGVPASEVIELLRGRD